MEEIKIIGGNIGAVEIEISDDFLIEPTDENMKRIEQNKKIIQQIKTRKSFSD